MALTYTNPLPTATTGTVLTASNYNNLIGDVNNLVKVPKARIRQNATVSFGASGSTLQYDTSDYAYDCTTSTGASARITIATAGYYLVTCNQIFTFSGTATQLQGFIIQYTGGGITASQASSSSFYGSSTLQINFVMSNIVYAAASDYFTSQLTYSGATSVSTYGSSALTNTLAVQFLSI